MDDPTKLHAINLIKKIIKQWGLNEAEVKDSRGEVWWLPRNSARFLIRIFSQSQSESNPGEDAVEVCAHIMEIPDSNEKKLELYEHILFMNNISLGVWFAVRNKALMLMSTRSLEGLDFVELKRMVNDVQFYADRFEPDFKNRFTNDPDRRPAQ